MNTDKAALTKARATGDKVNKTKLIVALLTASAFGILSALMIRSPVEFGAASIFLFPGFVLSIITSGNVHDFRTWVVVLGNSAFYFGIVYFAWEIWERYTRSVASDKKE